MPTKHTNAAALAEPAPSSPEAVYQRALETIAEYEQRIEASSAAILSIQAQITANDVKRQQTAADIKALPERLRSARANLLLDPGPSAERRHDELTRLQTTTDQALAQLNEQRVTLQEELDGLVNDRDAAATMLPALRRAAGDAFEAIGQAKLAVAQADVSAKLAVVQQARDALSAAEEALSRAREQASADLALNYVHLLDRAPDLRPRVLGHPAVAIIQAAIEFRRTLELALVDRSLEDVVLTSGHYLSAGATVSSALLASAIANHSATAIETGRRQLEWNLAELRDRAARR